MIASFEMNSLFLLILLGSLVWLILKARPRITPADAAARVAAGTAILVDVREPAEWADGVAAPALLLALSDLNGSRAAWRPVLAANPGQEFIVYCRSGMRSGQAVSVLRREGFAATNLGGFSGWQSAGLPVRRP